MAVGDFPEGATATHKDGRKIVFRNGEWRVLQGASGSGGSSGSKPAGVEQGNANAFLIRALGANDSYVAQKVGPRGVVGDAVATVAPSVVNALSSDQRQVAEAAKREFITAILRKDSGAAIGKEEYENADLTYFAQPGDGDAVIQQKASARDRAIQGLAASAGSAVTEATKQKYPNLFPQEAKGGDPASGVPGAASDGSGAPPTPPGTPPDRGTLMFNDELPEVRAGAKRLTSEQEAYISGVAQRGGSPDEIIAAHKLFGMDLAPERATAIFKAYQNPANRDKPLPFDYSKEEAVKQLDPGDGSAGSFFRGVTSNVPFSREIAAGITSLADGDMTYNQALEKEQGYRAYDEANHGTAYTLGSVAGAIPLGGAELLGARAASRAAGVAAVRAGRTADEARIIANRVFAQRSAAEAAAYSGVYAAGNADGSALDRLGAGVSGAAVGGALGGTLALAGGRFARSMAARGRGGPRPPTGGQEVLAAAERQNIVPFPADVGGAATRRATSAAAQTIGGAGPIVRGAQATVESARAVRDRVAAWLGNAVGVEEAGQVARRGIDAYRARTSAVIGRIYDAAEAAGGQTRIATPEALRVLNQELSALEESPVQGAGVGILQGLRDQLQGDVTVRGLRNARTLLREEFENNGLRRSNTERIASRVLDAANDDIVAGLRAQGQDRAANLYQRADRMWRERLANIDENLTPILGDADGARAKSGEQVVQALKQAMSGNNRRFIGFLNSLPPEERGIVRASLVSRMGQATKGQQDETGEVFSLSTFLTNWNDIGNRAKTALFGEEGRAALNDLARYAAGSREAQRYANFSNTGGAIGNLATGATISAGPLALVGTLMAQYGAGRLLSSPAFARWLARPPRNITPASSQAYVARLTRIARAEPAIANDVLALQQRLSDAFGGAVTRLAADERRDRANIVDGQEGQPAGQQQRLQP